MYQLLDSLCRTLQKKDRCKLPTFTNIINEIFHSIFLGTDSYKCHFLPFRLMTLIFCTAICVMSISPIITTRLSIWWDPDMLKMWQVGVICIPCYLMVEKLTWLLRRVYDLTKIFSYFAYAFFVRYYPCQKFCPKCPMYGFPVCIGWENFWVFDTLILQKTYS